MTYAKLLSSTSIDTNPPKAAVIDDKFVIGTLPASYLATLGYYPLEQNPVPPTVEGHHYEMSYAYDDVDTPTKVVMIWSLVANPPAPAPAPREFSKRKLYRALKSAGIWDSIKEYMEANDVWEDWEYATTLMEDDPLIMAAIGALQQSLGLSQEQLDGILAASVAD